MKRISYSEDIRTRQSELIQMESKDLCYQANLSWDYESGGYVNFQSYPQLNLKLDLPESFGGKGRYPCPDELFLSSIGGCLLTTFLHCKQKLEFCLQELQVSIQGRVKYIGHKGYRLIEISAIIIILVEEIEKKKAQDCADFTIKYCHLTRSLEKGIKVKIDTRIDSPSK